MPLLVLLLAGCAATGHPAGTRSRGGTAQASHASAHQPQAATVTAQIVLPVRTMTAGSRMTGYVLVQNHTGRALHMAGCQTLFQVQLSSRSYRPVIAWLSCLQRLSIPAGQSRYRIIVLASHDQCTRSQRTHGLTRCLPDGGPPPLPPGTYQARLYQLGHLVQAPPPITVQVTKSAATR